METQKIVNLFIDTNSVSLQSLQQENGMLLMTKITQNMVKEMKMFLALNLRQKLLNQVFVIIQMHIYL